MRVEVQFYFRIIKTYILSETKKNGFPFYSLKEQETGKHMQVELVDRKIITRKIKEILKKTQIDNKILTKAQKQNQKKQVEFLLQKTSR